MYCIYVIKWSTVETANLYRDDPDQQNLIDWIQEGWLQCCGIDGPSVKFWFLKFSFYENVVVQDWNMNIYFNCSSEAVGSREACGVPFSCCKPKEDEVIKNKQCGYDVRKDSYVSLAPKLSYLSCKTNFQPLIY